MGTLQHVGGGRHGRRAAHGTYRTYVLVQVIQYQVNHHTVPENKHQRHGRNCLGTCTTTSLVTTYSYAGVVRHEHPTAPRRHVQVRFVVPHGICLIRRGGRMIVFCFGIQNKHTLNDLAQNPHLNLNLLLFARLFEDSIAHPLSTKRQIFAMIRIIPIARDGLLSNPCG